MMSIVTEEAGKKALCARLARVEGQLRGLQKLIQAEAESEQVAQQMLWPHSIRIRPLVTFDRPFAVSELSQDGSAGSWLAAIQERARLLLALRGAVQT